METEQVKKSYEALQIEAVSSGRKNAAVELKWADLLYIEIPQELQDQWEFPQVVQQLLHLEVHMKKKRGPTFFSWFWISSFLEEP